jgi:hypothetical protein
MTHNEKFLQRLLSRRPEERQRYEARLQQLTPRGPRALEVADEPSDPGKAATQSHSRARALETLVSEERPVLFVKNGQIDTVTATILGPEAVDLIRTVEAAKDRLTPKLALVGRIDVTNFAPGEFVGTAWLVAEDVVVTNRHVAFLIARAERGKFVFSRGVGGRPIAASLCTAHEFDDAAPESSRVFAVSEVLYIEPESGPTDIAFLKIKRRSDGGGPAFIDVEANDLPPDVPVCVVGYPARASKWVIRNQELMQKLYLGQYDVKRVAPGFSMAHEDGAASHDCTTLGGNSGSVVLNLATGNAVGLHFAGLYEHANYAVRASVLSDYVRQKKWNGPVNVGASLAEPADVGNSHGVRGTEVTPTLSVPGTVTVDIPLKVTVSLGPAGVVDARVTADVGQPELSVARVETALQKFWERRPDGVIGARVGFRDGVGEIGEDPLIVASVPPDRVAMIAGAAPSHFEGVPVVYAAAEPGELVEARPDLESVTRIAYDDVARTGGEFSLEPVHEVMEVTMHIGPEYSWEVLGPFLGGAKARLVSAMYEFHARHIKDAIESRLEEKVDLKLVLDNATFSRVRNEKDEFDREVVFDAWDEKYNFERIVAPEGTTGLISDAYHIKVTVRDSEAFWLSSGNWKTGSSQPIITQAQRDDAMDVDLPGNREWHVVVKNATLANRFQSHILQDFKHSTALGGGPLPKSRLEETFIYVPIEEGLDFERRPASAVLEPLTINRKVKVRPLLTPDREGAIYSEAVLELIRSAKKSLLFQIPYIAMPSNPRSSRGYIDELIKALTEKLETLADARVILRAGSSRYSSPKHAAWYFKSKGVSISKRLRVIENHHTKGMIIDGRRVLLGSHNWSRPGVTLNRDASLLFDDDEVATYYTKAFELDWERSNAVKPTRYRAEAPNFEAVGPEELPGYRRVALSEWLSDE